MVNNVKLQLIDSEFECHHPLTWFTNSRKNYCFDVSLQLDLRSALGVLSVLCLFVLFVDLMVLLTCPVVNDIKFNVRLRLSESNWGFTFKQEV